MQDVTSGTITKVPRIPNSYTDRLTKENTKGIIYSENENKSLKCYNRICFNLALFFVQTS